MNSSKSITGKIKRRHALIRQSRDIVKMNATRRDTQDDVCVCLFMRSVQCTAFRWMLLYTMHACRPFLSVYVLYCA